MDEVRRAKTNCYIGRCTCCGAIRAAVVDEPGHEKETAKDVAEFVREGLRVESMSVEAVRAASWKCTCDGGQKDLGL